MYTDWVLLGRSNTVQYSLHHPEFQTLMSDPVVFVSSDQLVSVFLVGSDTFLFFFESVYLNHRKKVLNRKWKEHLFEIFGLT